MDKLFQMSLHNSCLAAQRDVNVKELETKMQQVNIFYIYFNYTLGVQINIIYYD